LWHLSLQIGEIDVYAELLPEDKVRIVQELKDHGITAMVGDGINDAPALAAADLGIAMGVAGSAIAMETADVALMTNDLRKLAAAMRLGLDCRWKIGQNVTFSFVTKLLIIGLAAGGYASLWAAVVADVGTCLAVIFNSMRILKKSKQHHGHGNILNFFTVTYSSVLLTVETKIVARLCTLSFLFAAAWNAGHT
jgi:Cd2+/Zn2+-exporting ATPase